MAKSRDTIIGRSHLTGYTGWPPPQNIKEHLEVFAKYIDNHVGDDTILDLGCGDGSIDRILAEMSPGKTITGVDLEKHKQWNVKRPKNLTFRAASIFNLPFQPSSFDTVIIKDVLHHLENPTEALVSISKLARQQVLVIEANRYNPVSFVRMVKIAKHEHFSHRKLKRVIGHHATIQTHEAHVWPESLAFFGKVHDFIFNKVPLLSRLRNYNFATFEPDQS